MAPTRRQVLAGGAVAVAGCAVRLRRRRPGPCRRRACAGTVRSTVAAPGDLSTWAGVRRELPLDPRLRHVAAFLLAGHPRAIREAIGHHRDLLDADPEGCLRSADERADPAGGAARYLGAKRDEIALTTSTTMGLAIIYRALRLRGREEIPSTVHDHFATDASLRLSGGRVRRVPLYADAAAATADEIARDRPSTGADFRPRSPSGSASARRARRRASTRSRLPRGPGSRRCRASPR